MHKQSSKSRRIALFSENERLYLQGRLSYNRIRKSQFHHDLEIRFDEFLKDLELLRTSENLKNWRLLRKEKYKKYFLDSHFFMNIFLDWKQTYPTALRTIPKHVDGKKIMHYWLDPQTTIFNIDERVFEPEFLFRRLKNIEDSHKRFFVLAYENGGILPYARNDAITFDEVKRRLSGESKVRTNVKISPSFRDLEKQSDY